MIVASLYNLPLTVLKSSASASVADRSAKIASVVAYSFTLGAFCLFCSPHGNDKMIHELSQMAELNSLKIVIILLALASACFGQEKTHIAIDCTFNNSDVVKLHLRGFSNTKVAPEKIAVWRYSRPEFNQDSIHPGVCYCRQRVRTRYCPSRPARARR